MKLTEDLKSKLRLEFVQGIANSNGEISYPTLDDLIKKYKLAKTTLYRYAKTAGWREEKDRYQSKLNARLDRKRQREMVEAGGRIDKKSVDIANELLNTVGYHLHKNKENAESGKKVMNPTYIYSLANATLIAQKVAKLALGEATQNLKIDATISEQPLQQAVGILEELKEAKRTGNLEAIH